MKIHRLDPQVVAKVAATEIIASPVNALKELLENSLDAGATALEIVVKDGGFKMLQVGDNGGGIDDEDLEILCQRHTTSKLKSIQDLEALTTLGFRGEALASISQISHVSVVTKLEDQVAATQAIYEFGVLKVKKPIAGTRGTRVTVEDMFYNVPTRLRALKDKSAEEYQKIVDVVTRYAINYSGSFSCKRHGDGQPLVISGQDARDKIRRVYGSSVANSLIEVNFPGESTIGLRKTVGYVSNADYYSKKALSFIFFVNDRLVSCEPLRKGIQKLYSAFVPKGGFPFVYLSLRIDPDKIDVNVHPSKRELKILDETDMIESIVQHLSDRLLTRDSSRKYMAQSFISSNTLPAVERPTAAPRYEYNLVRTDPSQSTIASFARPASEPRVRSNPTIAPDIETPSSAPAESTPSPTTPAGEHLEYRDLQLASIAALKQELSASMNTRVTKIITNHTFVGAVDPVKSLAAIQYDVRLYLVDFYELSLLLFYQIAIADIGNFGTIHLGDGVSIDHLCQLAGIENANFDMIETMAPMLQDYFRIDIQSRENELVLVQIPLLISGYLPSMSRLPQFFKELAQLEFSDEKVALQGVSKALANFHAPVQAQISDIELIFDIAKKRLVATHDLASSVVEIANLPGLYRVFERC